MSEQDQAPDEGRQDEGVQPVDPEAQAEGSPDVQTQESPDDDAGPAVEPTPGDQGEQVADSAAASGFNPDAPVRTSAPPAEAQSGVPALSDGSNEGVEPQPEYAGSVDAEQADGEDADGE